MKKEKFQDRAERSLDIVERGAHRTARQPRQVGHRTDRLQRAEHIGAGLRIKGVGIEEVGAAEQIEHGRPGCRQIDIGPVADLRELTLLELREGAVEELCVALPARVLRERHQRRIRRRLHARKEARGIVESDVGGTRGRNGRSQQGESDGRNSHGSKHVYSRCDDVPAATGRLRKTA
ncbi:hypothetical protein ACVWYI_005637 [Bradyrhizobium sp. LB13.1]